MTELGFASKRELMQALAKRDGFFCYLCDKQFSKQHPPTLDHIKPLSKGGSWHFDNLALAHLACNQDKGDREFVNGVLEPKPQRQRADRSQRKSALDNLCDLCNNGRLLQEQETCPQCQRTPSGTYIPMYLWRQPKQCDHDATACWLCFVGIVQRKTALESLVTG